MGDLRDELELEYCPPLDPALLLSLLSEFDLDQEDQIRNVRGLLDSIKESAQAEDTEGFDASGTGANGAVLANEQHTDPSVGDTSISTSTGTDLTSLSNDLRTVDLNEDGHDDLEDLDEDGKIMILLHVCQDRIHWNQAQYVLRKSKGRVYAAMDELLTLISFEDAGSGDDAARVPYKGIDAFSEEHTARKGRKRKSKGNGTRYAISGESSTVSVVAPPNPWQCSQEDVHFITSRLRATPTSVMSMYHKNGASVSRTIDALLQDSIAQNKSAQDEDPVVVANTLDLIQDFPTLPENYARALIRLTHPSTVAAHELAKAWSARSTNGGLQIIPSYVPLVHPNEDDPPPNINTSRQSHASPTISRHSNLDAPDRVSAYAADRDALQLQANASYRRAKSDRLMSAAAAYYSQESRKREMSRLAASAEATDDRAAAQSSPSQLDLHGIDVLNGVRIARTYVESWWSGLGESRVNGRAGAAERAAGYRIIVGRGTHSEGGRSKLGPAVRRMLSEGGWRFESEGAAVLVRGRAR